VVLHQMDMASQKSTFPIALGIRITAVDDSTFSQTGEAYSAISLPFANTHAPRLLQQDDTALAYEFARKFPGYTSDNLSDKGIHEVTARRFCLVSADHPLVSAVRTQIERSLTLHRRMQQLAVARRSRRTRRSCRWARSR